VTGLANVRHISRIRFLEHFCVFADRRSHTVAQLNKAITGHTCRRSLYVAGTRWHGVGDVNTLRELRRSIGLKQEEFASLLHVPLDTFRTWDSGRRAVPAHVFAAAKRVVADRPHQTELLSLDVLARELGVHERTLRAAARSGRLVVEFSSRSAFGRPIRLATRAAAAEFMRRYYRRCYSRYCAKPTPPNISVPSDYYRRLRSVRRDLRLSQSAFAERIGAAGKAVVYQWETRKRRPSPVFFQRIQNLSTGAFGQ
jgi:DNA-binding transcriptional regulator YiaG